MSCVLPEFIRKHGKAALSGMRPLATGSRLSLGPNFKTPISGFFFNLQT